MLYGHLSSILRVSRGLLHHEAFQLEVRPVHQNQVEVRIGEVFLSGLANGSGRQAILSTLGLSTRHLHNSVQDALIVLSVLLHLLVGPDQRLRGLGLRSQAAREVNPRQLLHWTILSLSLTVDHQAPFWESIRITQLLGKGTTLGSSLSCHSSILGDLQVSKLSLVAPFGHRGTWIGGREVPVGERSLWVHPEHHDLQSLELIVDLLVGILCLVSVTSKAHHNFLRMERHPGLVFLRIESGLVRLLIRELLSQGLLGFMDSLRVVQHLCMVHESKQQLSVLLATLLNCKDLALEAFESRLDPL